jgi:energy-coupling factor transport system permease protein
MASQFTVQFIRGESVLNRMDPLSKLLWILIVGVVGFVLGSPLLLGLLLVAVVSTGLVFGRIPIRPVLRTSVYLLILAGGVAFGQLLIRKGGAVLVPLPLVPITYDGVEWALRFAFRVMLVSYTSLMFVWTTDPRKLVMGLIYLGLPYRFGYGLFVALRFMPLIEHEAQVIGEAQAVRGVKEASGRIEGARRYAIPLLVAAIRRSEDVAITMDSRAFGAYPDRTYVERFHWTTSGIAWVVIWLIFSALLTYAEWRMGGLFTRI